MAKDLSKISRNNKSRGRKFENKVASTLGWKRVPYSGANRAFGKGDVVDGYPRQGYWRGECKTVTPSSARSLCVSEKWIEQAFKDEGDNRSPMLLAKLVGDEEAWVIMTPETAENLLAYGDIEYEGVLALTASGAGRGFVLKRPMLDAVGGGFWEVNVSDPFGPDHTWYLMRLDTLAAFFKEYPDAMVHA